MKITDKQLVREFEKKEQHQEKYNKLANQIDLLTKKLSKEKALIDALNRIEEFYKGVALYTDGCREHEHIYPVLNDNRRNAYIYLNCHNNRTWGIELRRYNMLGLDGQFQGGLVLGKDFETREEVEKIAKDWIATGRADAPGWRFDASDPDYPFKRTR